MNQAWQKREEEQKHLIEKLMRDAHTHIGADDSHIFFLKLGTYLMGNMVARMAAAQTGMIPAYITLNLEVGQKLIRDHAVTIEDAIGAFSRTPEEEQKLVGIFLKHCLQAGLSQIDADYLHQEVHRPEMLFEAKATAQTA